MFKFILGVAVLVLFTVQAIAGDCHAKAAAAATSCGGAVVLKAKGRAAPGVVANSRNRRAALHATRASTLAVKAASTPVVVAQATTACAAAAPVVLQVQPRARRVRTATVLQGTCAACAGPVVSAATSEATGGANASANAFGGGNARAEANTAQPPLEPLPPSVGGPLTVPPIPQASR